MVREIGGLFEACTIASRKCKFCLHRGVPPITTSAAHTGVIRNALLKFNRTRTCVVCGAQFATFTNTTLTRDTGRVSLSRFSGSTSSSRKCVRDRSARCSRVWLASIDAGARWEAVQKIRSRFGTTKFFFLPGQEGGMGDLLSFSQRQHDGRNAKKEEAKRKVQAKGQASQRIKESWRQAVFCSIVSGGGGCGL